MFTTTDSIDFSMYVFVYHSEQDEQFESWRKEFQQERLLRIVREREIMKETAKRCKSYKVREQEATDALERKRQNILAQRKAANVQATMRFQRNLPGFTVMDPDKFDRAIETITGRQLSNRSTPRRTSIMQQQQRVQRRVLNDFAAQVQSTLNQNEQFNDANTWDRESVDSLEKSNDYHPQQIISQPRLTGPIVRQNHVVNIQTRKTQPLLTNNSEFDSMASPDQQELLRRSYHESFFVKNTPVTGDEQVTAWLGANKNATISNNKHSHVTEKPSSLDENDPETNGRRKSILKRSPSIDSNPMNSPMNTKPMMETRVANIPQKRTTNDKVVVKDSLEVKNAKLLKELETQKKTVRFAQDSTNERCASDTQLVKPPEIGDQQTSLRRVQSAALLTLPTRPPMK
ncbi:unnamed protein product [Rotaria socialis]|uniref:Uncharacterized protein n=1 Tax=Rotaria socialis TaxID=392032 RepID=A0A820S9J5_9BILA|nr:unnamed protein product [Rotaria socialis]